MYFVYILYSSRINRYYVGFSGDVTKRLEYHNSLEFNKIWSRRGIPWELRKSLTFNSKTEALKVERFIKKQKSRALIEKIIASGWNG